ncbi:hypothetical protein [Acinetobacter sp. HR7]|uniref:hypothetical protein n=1 Tax=Acinetobacter sp. HR7 TaxID=1509403 RepID=UPI000537BCC9|nr:hypothetical protein [Acinetobacter sp. HR7]KGT48410.1 hypothetical protein GW12_05610 [Acinetobacter sp. HR7]
MDIQKEKDAYLRMLLDQGAITKDEFDDIVYKPEVNAFHSNYLSSRFIDNINWGWSAWQAAKAQAVPEGFVVVPKEKLQNLNKTIDALYECDGCAYDNRILSLLGDANIDIEAMIYAQEPSA